MIGRSLSHYEILEELGSGGMGVVYRARDERLHRSVAFKVLSERFAKDPDRRRRFLQEARSASAVNHPAIAQVYDADEADGVAFIAMEFVEGRTIRELVDGRELDALGAVEIVIQVAEGLARAHEAGIVHRDIKSENIMVTADGHAKILDFGLAKSLEAPTSAEGDADPEATIMRSLAATQEGMVVGTIGYMSPEQARGRDLDHRSDLFSLGIVLYEMVTGQRPFQGESALDTLHAIAFDETTPVTAIRANLPASLHRTIMKCLRKRPEDRYESAELLVRDLRGVSREIDSGISQARPLMDRLREGMESLRDQRERRWVLPAALAGLVLLVGLVVWLTDSGAVAGLLPFAFIGLLIYRRARGKRFRLVKSLAKKAAKMDEVRVVAHRDPQVILVVEAPLAKTFVHLNSMIEQINGKLFFGARFELVVRENLRGQELRTLLAAPGVVYVSDHAILDD
ncbi:MAG: hypothetical protein DHS20C21_20800 [Gemmatimonadota bacterium]|nr:MAG: hypothetical protein DHS20C21_20800 [Gemmatimonadota bacterium]